MIWRLHFSGDKFQVECVLRGHAVQPSGNAGQGGRKGPLVAQQHLQGLAMLLRHHLDGDELSLRLFEHQVRCPLTRLCCLAPTGCDV